MPESLSSSPDDIQPPQELVTPEESAAGVAAAKANMDQYRLNRGDHTPEEFENAGKWLALERQRAAHLAAQARKAEAIPEHGAQIIDFPQPDERRQTG